MTVAHYRIYELDPADQIRLHTANLYHAARSAVIRFRPRATDASSNLGRGQRGKAEGTGANGGTGRDGYMEENTTGLCARAHVRSRTDLT
jgi:hypothetical protein